RSPHRHSDTSTRRSSDEGRRATASPRAVNPDSPAHVDPSAEARNPPAPGGSRESSAPRSRRDDDRARRRLRYPEHRDPVERRSCRGGQQRRHRPAVREPERPPGVPTQHLDRRAHHLAPCLAPPPPPPGPRPPPPPETPDVTRRGPRCHPAGLAGSLRQLDSSAGHRYAVLILTNTSRRTCTVYGYGGIQLATASRQPVPTSQHRDRMHPPSLLPL